MKSEPSKTRSEQKRQSILSAAIELFCLHGFPNTSMSEIAKVADVSKQTVYSHFGSKDDLFVAAIESKCVAHQVSEDLFSDTTNPEAVITEFASKFSDMIIQPEVVTVFRACVAQSESHPQLSKLFYQAGPDHVIDTLAQYLTEVSKLGKYDFGDCRNSSTRLCLMLFGEMKLQLELGLEITETNDERASYVQGCAEMFLKAHKKELA
ncbi:MAG: TetR/AcrR family transcriptional regulator [Parashewanella sp.]